MFQIAAKINPAGAQNNQDTKLKRPLEDGSGNIIRIYNKNLL